MKIYIYCTQNAHGIKIIIDNLKKAFIRKGIECEHISSLRDIEKCEIIIPYGVKDSLKLLKNDYNADVVFAADAITLGFKNKILHYIKFKRIWSYDFWYSIYGYLRYYIEEKKMLKNYKKIILVSMRDIDYLHETYHSPIEKFIYATNGIDRVDKLKKHKRQHRLSLGILATWYSSQIIEESKWFIEEIYIPYVKSKKNKEIELILAGRGPKIKQFEGLKNIKVIGEVDSLGDFFSQIDVMISSNPKGCGILNRVLDSFAHRVPVCGVSESFSGFSEAEGCYMTFSNLNDFSSLIEIITDDEHFTRKVADRAYLYIKRKHDWIQIYDDLVEKLLDHYKKEHII